MPTSAPFKRAWATVIPTAEGLIQMIGYATGEQDSWHLAFVKPGSTNDSEALGLWVIPGSCVCLSSRQVPENMSTLANEFRRFARSQRGIAISLFQHPRNFGPLMLGEGADAMAFLGTRCCGGDGRDGQHPRCRDERCSIKKILEEIGVGDVCLEYPCAPEWKDKLES